MRNVWRSRIAVGATLLTATVVAVSALRGLLFKTSCHF